MSNIKSQIEEELPSISRKLDDIQKTIIEQGQSVAEVIKKQASMLQKQLLKIRYLGFGLLSAIVIGAIYFGMR